MTRKTTKSKTTPIGFPDLMDIPTRIYNVTTTPRIIPAGWAGALQINSASTIASLMEVAQKMPEWIELARTENAAVIYLDCEPGHDSFWRNQLVKNLLVSMKEQANAAGFPFGVYSILVEGDLNCADMTEADLVQWRIRGDRMATFLAGCFDFICHDIYPGYIQGIERHTLVWAQRFLEEAVRRWGVPVTPFIMPRCTRTSEPVPAYILTALYHIAIGITGRVVLWAWDPQDNSLTLEQFLQRFPGFAKMVSMARVPVVSGTPSEWDENQPLAD